MKKLLVGLVMLGVFAAGVFFAPTITPQFAPYLVAFERMREARNLNGTSDTTLTAPPAVSVVKVADADFTETVAVSGSLVPREEILVAPEVEGFRVLDLKVDVGSIPAHRRESGVDAARRSHVIVLDERLIAQGHAMVLPPAATDGVFLHGP